MSAHNRKLSVITPKRLASCVLQFRHFVKNPVANTTGKGPGVDSASNRNEYQESSWGVKGGRRVSLISPHCLENVEASTSHNPMGLHGLLQG
jgi:hypothetical protein